LFFLLKSIERFHCIGAGDVGLGDVGLGDIGFGCCGIDVGVFGVSFIIMINNKDCNVSA
jgi:hypothetical protein